MARLSELRGPTFRALLRAYLLSGLVIIATIVAFFTVRISRQVDEQAQLTTGLLASIVAETIFSATPDSLKLAPLSEAIHNVAFPFVVTDRQGRPVIWNVDQVGVPLPESFSHVQGETEDPDIARVRELTVAYDRRRAPIPVTAPGGGVALGQLHFGESALSRQLLWMPWLGMMLIVAFMGVALLAFRNMKRSEQRSIWVGMAKETAHQMGTPLTSANGWLALLREEELDEVAMTPSELVRELQSDVDRLSKVSARFSQIGSRPKRRLERVDGLVTQVCRYFQRRLPHLGKRVQIVEQIEEVPLAPINLELLDWALENLVKNALDAIDKEDGVVTVSCRRSSDDWIELLVDDNGKGMTSTVAKRVFEPGFTTKPRGWGMGLVLVHRIIVEYHEGHIQVSRSVPGEGTCMRVLLPTR